MKLVMMMTLAAAVMGGAALAQSEQREGNPALKSPRPDSDQSSSRGRAAGGDTGSARLEPGSNSFTESQARSKIEQAGYQNVTDLKKDEQGIWRGKAQKGGQSLSVGLDFKGNVSTQ
jgi:putative membrane protein